MPRVLFCAALAVAVTVGTTQNASAVDPGEIGVFPTWTVSGTAGAYTAVPSFPASAGFPATTLTSTGTTLAAPTGASAFLGASTDFGAEFGSTRSQPYLTLVPAAGLTNSVTTLTFAAPPPEGWGFALGDVDADWAFIQAYAGPGLTDPVALADLGYRSSDNYCDSSPRPSTCGAPPYTDAPVWVQEPELFDGINYVPGTLRGNSRPGEPLPTRDTSGAYGWFTPRVPIRTLQITFGIREGFPAAQLWLATPAPKVIVSGVVATPDAPGGQVAPPGTSVQVNDASGAPLRGIDDQPLSVPVDRATGTYSLELEQAAEGYQAVVIPPPGYTAPPPIAIPGLPDDPVTLAAAAPPIVIAPVAEPPEPEGPLPVPAAPPEPRLAESGATPEGYGALALFGLVLFACGLVLTRTGAGARTRA